MCTGFLFMFRKHVYGIKIQVKKQGVNMFTVLLDFNELPILVIGHVVCKHVYARDFLNTRTGSVHRLAAFITPCPPAEASL